MKGYLYIIISVMILVMSGCNNEHSEEMEKVQGIEQSENDSSTNRSDSIMEKENDDELSLENETTSIISELQGNEQSVVENTDIEKDEQVDRGELVITFTSRQQIVEIQTASTSDFSTESVTYETTKVDEISDVTATIEIITTEEAGITIHIEDTTEYESTEGVTTSNAVIEYSPDRVCALATTICQQTGLRKSSDGMDESLANDTISIEEYEMFYPYAGLGYLGVFFETDLSEACTITGRKLSSEQAIAEYLAEIVISEAMGEYFYIECAGVYIHHGIPMYEFRCYR